MKLKQLIYKLTHPTVTAATAALLCMGVCGCSSGDSPIGDDVATTPDKEVWLNLRLSVPRPTPTAGRGNSRADDAAGHPEEAANSDESYIDCTGSNMALMFFDDRQMLWRVLTPKEMTVVPAGNDGMYDLQFKLNSDYFGYAGTADNIECTYMLVANMNGTGSGSTFSTEAIFAKTPAQIADMHTGFGMPDQSTEAWIPSAPDNKLIPMAGIARGRISRTDLNNSTADAAADLGTLNMQRAMAKIRILDAIPLQTDTDMDRITAVTIQGCNTRGAYIPAGTPIWYSGTTEVETATELPEWYAPDGRIKMLNTPQTSAEENKTYQNAFVCYVPECTLTGKEAKMIITVAEKESGATQDFEINLSKSYGGFGGLSALARNHIYEFKVEMSTIGKMSLKYTVCDWDQYTVNPPTFE